MPAAIRHFPKSLIALVALPVMALTTPVQAQAQAPRRSRSATSRRCTGRCRSHRHREELVGRGRPEAGVLDLPGRRAADRGAASKSWDVGGTGSVPAVLGHVRFGIKTIGVTNDESAGNALLVRKDMAATDRPTTGEEHEGPDDPAHRQLDRRLRGAVVPEEVRAREEPT